MSFIKATIAGIGVNPQDYHANKPERGSAEYVISPSSLLTFATTCPRKWKRGYEPPPSESKDWGNLFDCWMLTREQFEKRYAVQPETYPAPADHIKVKRGKIKAGDPLPWNGNANACSDWKERQESQGLKIISTQDYVNVQQAGIAFDEDEMLFSFLKSSDRQVQVVGVWKDEATGLLIPVQCLIDLVPRLDTAWQACLGDLKTSRNAGLGAFERFAEQMGYHVQGAFDLDLYNAAKPEEMRDSWCWLVSENYKPWETGRRLATNSPAINTGRVVYQNALARYAQCLASGKWPGYDDNNPKAAETQGWTLVYVSLRAQEAALEGMTFKEPEEEPEQPNPQPTVEDIIP